MKPVSSTWRGPESLSAMEAKLKPEVILAFEKIAATYKKLLRLQKQRLELIQQGEEPAVFDRHGRTSTTS